MGLIVWGIKEVPPLQGYGLLWHSTQAFSLGYHMTGFQPFRFELVRRKNLNADDEDDESDADDKDDADKRG